MLQVVVDGAVHVVRDVGQRILVRREVAGLLILQGMEDVAIILVVDEDQRIEVDVDMVALNAVAPLANVILAMEQRLQRLQHVEHTRL